MALLQNIVLRDTHANRPAAGSAGRLYFETDTGQLFRDNGSVWQVDDTTLLYTAKGQLLAASGSGTVGSLPAGTDGTVLTADSTQTLGVKWATASGALTKLDEVIIGGGGAANIAFSSIPGRFRSVLVEWQAASSNASGGTDIRAQFNGDTAANYDYARTYHSGATFTEDEAQSAVSLNLGSITAASGPATTASQGQLVVVNYAGTTFYKTAGSLYDFRNGTGAGGITTGKTSGVWRSTAAITSILLFPSSGNFIAGSTAALYGIL